MHSIFEGARYTADGKTGAKLDYLVLKVWYVTPRNHHLKARRYLPAAPKGMVEYARFSDISGYGRVVYPANQFHKDTLPKKVLTNAKVKEQA